MAFAGVTINSDVSVAGRAAVYLGAPVSTFASMGQTLFPVGALDGTVSISPNQDILKLQRSDGQNPYAVIETAYDFQVTFNVQETDIFNLALALSYKTSDTGSATVGLDSGLTSMTQGADAIPLVATGSTVDGARLTLGSDGQSGYRAMMIRVEGGLDDGTGDNSSAGDRTIAEWQFWKVKIQATGSIDYDRTGAVTYPVTAHCLGNSSDVVGQFITANSTVRTAYGSS